MKSIADRIVEGLSLRGLKQAELVEKTGIGKSSISTYISGEYEPKQRNIYKIALALDVNEAWLMGNDVPMDRVDPNKAAIFSNTDLDIISKYKKLDEKGKHTVNTVLDMEYNRCEAENYKDNVHHLILNAAHAIEGSSEEDKQHDEDIMDDENF